MALEGTIRDFGLPDIFQLIGLQRKTGILTLRNEKETVTITFENGLVVMADSSGKRLEDRLGNVLVKQGKMPKERLDDALQTQKATLQRLGHVLLTNNYINSKDLKEALQVQVSQIVFKVFRWRDGDYHFAPTEAVEYDREHFNPMSADFILMEGIRMVDEWPIIEKKIPSLDIVFRSIADPAGIEVAEGNEGAEALFGGGGESKKLSVSSSNKIRLTPEEDRIFRRVDGTRTVQAIIDSTGLGEFEVCRILYDLLNRNIISTAGRSATAERVLGSYEPVAPSKAPAYVISAAAIIVALAAVAVRGPAPFALLGTKPMFSRVADDAVRRIARARLERLDQGVAAYCYVRECQNGVTLGEVVASGLVDPMYLRDPWRRPYHFATTSRGYLLGAVDKQGKLMPGLVMERALPHDKR
jgi:hypothetical protein